MTERWDPWEHKVSGHSTDKKIRAHNDYNNLVWSGNRGNKDQFGSYISGGADQRYQIWENLSMTQSN